MGGLAAAVRPRRTGRERGLMDSYLEWRRYKGTQPEYRAGSDDAGPVISGYAAVFNRYSQNLGGFVERIMPGAFDDALGRDLVGLFNHSEDRLLGSVESDTLRVEVDDVGLRYEIDLDLDDPDARSVASKVRRGLLRGSSFSFRLTPGGDEWSETEQGFPLRSLVAVERTQDVGPVTFPAYKITQEGDLAVALRSIAPELRSLNESGSAAETPPAGSGGAGDDTPVGVESRRSIAGRWLAPTFTKGDEHE